MTKAPYPIYCAVCGRRLRWRIVDGARELPVRCPTPRCKNKLRPGDKSIVVIAGENR